MGAGPWLCGWPLAVRNLGALLGVALAMLRQHAQAYRVLLVLRLLTMTGHCSDAVPNDCSRRIPPCCPASGGVLQATSSVLLVAFVGALLFANLMTVRM